MNNERTSEFTIINKSASNHFFLLKAEIISFSRSLWDKSQSFPLKALHFAGQSSC